MKRLKRLAIVGFAFAIALGAVLPATKSAFATSGDSSSALSIPPRKNYVIKPGASVKDKLVISNVDGAQPLDLKLSVIDFTYTDTSGTAKLLLDRKEPTTWSLKPYVSMPDHVTIPAGGTKSVPISIAIPAGHGAGSLYSAILYSAGPPGTTGGSNVGLSASGTTLVFTNIPGKVSESLKLKQLGAYREASAGVKAGFSYITTSMPQEMGYTLENGGNVVESPVGAMTLTDMFGRKTNIDNINPRNLLALIGQTRTFTNCIKLDSEKVKLDGTSSNVPTCANPKLWPGHYNVAFDSYYGQNGNQTQEVVGHASFWYLPVWFIVVVLVLLALIAYGVWRAKRRIQGVTPKAKHQRRR